MTIKAFMLLTFIASLGACRNGLREITDLPEDKGTTASYPTGRYLYVASGACYGGGVTAAAASNIVSRFNLSTGSLESTVIDYNIYAAGDSPADIVDYDDDHFLVLVENTSAGGRRIEKVNKSTGEASFFYVNATAFNNAMRRIFFGSDGSFFISKNTAIEKFSPAKIRQLMGANPYVNAPAGACATSTTMMSSFAMLPDDKIVYVHSAASPNNKIGVIKATGYAAASDCLASQAAPATTALPTSVIRHSSGKLLVAYGSTTAASNLIYSYNIDSTSGAISGATAAYTNNSIINGPSEMIEDPSTGNVYVANSNAAYSNIEEFSFDSIAGTLTRTSNESFVANTVNTRCVSGMFIGN